MGMNKTQSVPLTMKCKRKKQHFDRKVQFDKTLHKCFPINSNLNRLENGKIISHK